ncbi:MAG: aminotransferase class V-fold PLP-dependent enzyme [Planctomycetota bacterium]
MLKAADSTPPLLSRDLREMFVGLDYEVPLLDGSRRRYVNLDNAATTPPLKSVLDCVNASAEWYSSVHRGTGFKSRVSTETFQRAHEKVLRFVGADPSYHSVVFCANATDGINRLSHRFLLHEEDVILVTVMEHHSNMLPWRCQGTVDYVRSDLSTGMLDLDDLEAKLLQYAGRVRLVAVTGASNVTGMAPPLKTVARLAHRHGAFLLVDASQKVAHRPIEMGQGNDPERIDFLAFSGHKMYAPFGSGALIGPRSFFEKGRPGIVGGGAVKSVTLDDVEWADVPDREEAGSPNLLGICALVEAMRALENLRMERIVAYEHVLTRKAIDRLSDIAGLTIFGAGGDCADRVGIIPFQLDAFDDALVAAVLSHEWGIGVRNGCFCAQPYVARLLGVSAEETRRHLVAARNGTELPHRGFVRISLALYNTEEEVEYLARAIESIVANGVRREYRQDRRTGEYLPVGVDRSSPVGASPDKVWLSAH